MEKKLGIALVTLAYRVLRSHVRREPFSDKKFDDLPEELWDKRGCFVTLEKYGDLRGCIGNIEPDLPLVKAVAQNTVRAASHDPRFSPVTESELTDITIEVSVLTVPEALICNSPEEIPDHLERMVHGVIVRHGFRGATYLPQVWEKIPDKIEFLESLCLKGGMDRNIWRSPETKISLYKAEVFHLS